MRISTASRTAAIAACIAAGAVSSAMPRHAMAEAYPIGDKVTMWADPYLIGSMRHLGEIYDSRKISRQDPVSELPRGAQIANLEFELAGQKRGLGAYFAESHTAGFIVLKNGRIVFEYYGQGADERSVIATASVAKSIVSTLVGVAIGDKLIRSVDDPISDYLPELKGTGYDGVPIKAVLQMSSGTNWLEDYGASVSDFVHMWDESVQRNVTPIIAFVRIAKPRLEPFSRWRYAAGDSIALGWLVSRVTGKTLSDYLAEKLWGPLGMEADANWVVDGPQANASEVAFCCFSATLRDYARFGLLMAQDGVWQGRRLLPEGWVREATQPDRPQVQPGKLYPGYNVGYQYQWWTFPGPDGAFTARGVNGQFLYVNPGQQMVIVATNYWPDYWNELIEGHTYAVFAAFAERLKE